MANRPAGRGPCRRDTSRCAGDGRVQSCGHRRRQKKARQCRKISNNRSGERRSAGLKWRAPRHDENDSDASEMLDRSRNKRHRQLRRRRQERVRGEKDRGADRAIVVVRVVAGVRRGQLRRLGSRAAYSRERGRCDGRRRDGHARMRRRVAAPARPAPANCQTACCESNASGEMIHRGQRRPYRISLARAPRSHNAIPSAHKPIGAGCGAEVTVL